MSNANRVRVIQASFSPSPATIFLGFASKSVDLSRWERCFLLRYTSFSRKGNHSILIKIPSYFLKIERQPHSNKYQPFDKYY